MKTEADNVIHGIFLFTAGFIIGAGIILIMADSVRVTKGYIIVDKEVIVCKNTKYFKHEKDMIRCESSSGEKHLVTGKFEFLKGVDE